MTTETSVKYLEHFVKYVRNPPKSKVILLFDIHSSHVSLEASYFCRARGIVMLGFPPHTTHKIIQPLDVSFFDPLKIFYNWVMSHPGSAITDRQVSQLLGATNKKIATVGNAINGFAATGTERFNEDICDEGDFAVATTT